MEHVSTPRKSVWRQTVPQAISNSAMVAMVTLCYFGLVSPTLDLVQTAQLVRSGFDVQVTNNPQQIQALRKQADAVIIATIPVLNQSAQTVPVALVQKTDVNNQVQLSYATIGTTQAIPTSGPFPDPVTAQGQTVITDGYNSIELKPAAVVPTSNPGNPLSSDSTMPMEPVEVSEEISAENYTTAIPESIAEIERLQIELDKLTAVMREAYALMNDSTLSAEKKEVIAGDINELKANIADTMQEQFGHMMGKGEYIPTGHFVTTPNNNGMNNYDGAGLGAPTVNTHNNGVVPASKPPVVIQSSSSSSIAPPRNPPTTSTNHSAAIDNDIDIW
jgi:hypothetical protein